MDREDACGFWIKRYEPCSSGCVSFHLNCHRDDNDYIECVDMSECELREKAFGIAGIIFGSLVGLCVICVVLGIFCGACKDEDEKPEPLVVPLIKADNYNKV